MNEPDLDATRQTHELKCVPPFFAAVLDGTKPFEARKHDRRFCEGDTLLLREWNGDYTGRELTRQISYVLVGGEFGIERGYCVLGLSDLALVGRVRDLEADLAMMTEDRNAGWQRVDAEVARVAQLETALGMIGDNALARTGIPDRDKLIGIKQVVDKALVSACQGDTPEPHPEWRNGAGIADDT